jgi:hypothetical protein
MISLEVIDNPTSLTGPLCPSTRRRQGGSVFLLRSSPNRVDDCAFSPRTDRPSRDRNPSNAVTIAVRARSATPAESCRSMLPGQEEPVLVNRGGTAPSRMGFLSHLGSAATASAVLCRWKEGAFGCPQKISGWNTKGCREAKCWVLGKSGRVFADRFTDRKQGTCGDGRKKKTPVFERPGYVSDGKRSVTKVIRSSWEGWTEPAAQEGLLRSAPRQRVQPEQERPERQPGQARALPPGVRVLLGVRAKS